MVGLKSGPQNMALIRKIFHQLLKRPGYKQLDLVLSVFSKENTVIKYFRLLIIPQLKLLGDD